MTATIKPAAPTRLPELRAELQLLAGGRSTSGEPSWLVHDPLQNRFVQIDVAAYETLRHWRDCGTIEELLQRVNAGGKVTIERAGVEQLVRFLDANRLTVSGNGEDWRAIAARAAHRHSLVMTLLHNYLFFRIPLFRPQRFLERTLPFALLLGRPRMRIVLMFMGLLGLYLVSRQWETYVGSFQGFFTWEGMAVSFLALAVVKAAHELGHAYTAVSFGCRVHTMGIAVMMMAPLMYTDVTDSWRLTDRRRRLLIDSAGIRVELGIAAVALFAWAFMPPGPARDVAFVLSAVSLISSLVINLNPFMRFDGYYLLSESIGVENLQPRAFALGRWKLRELLFGLRLPPPEQFSRPLARLLVVYAWATWIYRLILFVGIALVVYHYFFKALGILLFMVEIGYFIARPLAQEVAWWWGNRRAIARGRRVLISGGVAVASLLLSLVPLSTRVEIPAVVEAAATQRLYPLRPARVVSIAAAEGSDVKAGDILLTLESPDIEQELDVVRTKLALARLQYNRRAADGEDRSNSLVIEGTMAGLARRIEGLEAERAELVVRAPFDGRVAELDTAIHPGRWVSPRDALALVVQGSGAVARGYVAESDVWRIAPGSPARFVPEHPQRDALALEITQIAATGAAEIEIPDLASTHQGRIPVNTGERRRLVPAGAQYLVHLAGAPGAVPYEVRHRGIILAEGRAESLLARAWRQALKVMVRESGL